MKKFKKYILVCLLVIFTNSIFGQVGYNLSKFDKKMYHFGFLLSVNRSDFYIKNKTNINFEDSLLGVANIPQSGFGLHLLASLDMTPNFHLRFQPGLSWQDRGLQYRFLETSDSPEEIEVEYIRRTQAVYLEFPLILKLRSNRANNFAAFALLGGKYGLDMQSQSKTNNNLSNIKIVKLQRSDFSIVAGGGFDFFLPYFKFGIEMKTAFGIPNVLIPEDHNFSRTIDQLRTRTFIVSLTFEG